jgi:hypothetical protein
MDQEANYLALLANAVVFRLDGGTLELLDADRKRLVSFAPAGRP